MALARSDPDPDVITDVLRKLDMVPAGDSRLQALGNVAYHWARTAADLQEVVQWAEGLSEDQGREYVLAQINKASTEAR